MKKIAILGSTGSIGTQALDVIRRHEEEYKVTVLSCANRIDDLKKQIDEFNPELVVVAKEEDALSLKKEYPKLSVTFGKEGLIEAAESDYDILLNSLMGMRGLAPTYYAVKLGRKIAFANKETLVAGGKLITDTIKAVNTGKAHNETGAAQLLPVDSEHSAIFQCIQGNLEKPIKKILLTASGGPFRGYTLDKLQKVTLEQALKHPKWTMGAKITIDSASMMNKGLEVIEAKWLFDVEPEKIQILVHPQSVVHSMVEFMDTSIIAQLGRADMRVPISYAFAFPDRMLNYDFESLDFFKNANNLTFEEADRKVFKCIDFAYEALERGGSYTVALNAANEVLVDKFLKGKIRFIEIQEGIEKVLNEHVPKFDLTLEDILGIDEEIRWKLSE